MELPSKENAVEKKQSESVECRNTNANGVVIRVYTESVKTRSTKLSETNPYTHFSRERASETNGYDRRALLLAHSQQLRNAKFEKDPLQTNQSLPEIKSKKGIRLNQPIRICSCSSSMEIMLPSSTIRCRNERLASKESKEGNHSEKRRSNGKDAPPFLDKIKNIYTQLSCKDI